MPGPEELSLYEIDGYSVVHSLQTGLDTSGWNVPVDLVRERWPSGDEVVPPAVWVLMDFNSTAPWDLGSHGKELEIFIHSFATNSSQRDRLAEEITNLVRDVIPIYDWQDGNETNPSIVEYFNTQGDVEFSPIRATLNAPKSEQWRAVVHATLTRQDA
jgi:hypothetical protein